MSSRGSTGALSLLLVGWPRPGAFAQPRQQRCEIRGSRDADQRRPPGTRARRQRRCVWVLLLVEGLRLPLRVPSRTCCTTVSRCASRRRRTLGRARGRTAADSPPPWPACAFVSQCTEAAASHKRRAQDEDGALELHCNALTRGGATTSQPRSRTREYCLVIGFGSFLPSITPSLDLSIM